MTYYGTTATSTSKNPPNVLWQGGIGGRVNNGGVLSTRAFGAHVWLYNSTNGTSDVTVAGTFIDGGILGMYPGDIIIGAHNGGANLSSGVVWTGVLNSTESTLSTAAYNLTSDPSTSPAWG